MIKSILESETSAFYEGEERVLERIGEGLLVLNDDNTMRFFGKKKFVGGYKEEADHWYNLANIMQFKYHSNGIDAEVYFTATEHEPAQVQTFFYALKHYDASRWEEALLRKGVKQQVEQEQATPTEIKENDTIHQDETVSKSPYNLGVSTKLCVCGYQNPVEAHFCRQCGKPLT